MIAIARQSASSVPLQVPHERFEELLPVIRRDADFAFRHLRADARDEAVADVLAYCWTAYYRLAELGRLNLVYAGALARFGISRARDGRRVGCLRERARRVVGLVSTPEANRNQKPRRARQRRWLAGNRCRRSSLRPSPNRPLSHRLRRLDGLATRAAP